MAQIASYEGTDKQQELDQIGGTTMTMKILAFLRNHAHYWGVPHPGNTNNRLVQTCYECGAERQVKIELRPSPENEITNPYYGDHIAA